MEALLAGWYSSPSPNPKNVLVLSTRMMPVPMRERVQHSCGGYEEDVAASGHLSPSCCEMARSSTKSDCFETEILATPA